MKSRRTPRPLSTRSLRALQRALKRPPKEVFFMHALAFHIIDDHVQQKMRGQAPATSFRATCSVCKRQFDAPAGALPHALRPVVAAALDVSDEVTCPECYAGRPASVAP